MIDYLVGVTAISAYIAWTMAYLSTTAFVLALLASLVLVCSSFLGSSLRGHATRTTMVAPLAVLTGYVVIGESAFQGVGPWWLQALAFLVFLLTMGMNLGSGGPRDHAERRP